MEKLDIEFPQDVDLPALIRKAYALSSPQGLGFLHYEADGGLSDDDVAMILSRERPYCVFSMDYVKGRAVKFSLYRDGDKLYGNAHWYDHHDSDHNELLTSIGIKQEQIDAAREERRKANEAYERGER